MILLARNSVRLVTTLLFLAASALAQQAPNYAFSGSFGPSPDYVQDMVSADLNHDGKTDLVVLSSNGSASINVFMNNGNGTFSGPVSTNIDPDASRIAVGDFNRDGNLDVAVAIYHQGFSTGEVQVLTGDGAGHFTGIATYTVATRPNSIAVGDFNGDGAFDIAVLSENSRKVSLLLNNGTGGFNISSFSVPTYFDTTGGGAAGSDWVSDLVAGDFNGDGHMDLAYVDHCGDFNICPVQEERIFTLTRNSTGGFSPALLTQAATGLRRLHSADIDLDGKSDLYYAYDGCHTPCYGVVALFSNGGNSFTTTNPDQGNTGYVPTDAVVGDFNNDGLMDIAFTGVQDFASDPNGFNVVVQTASRQWSTSEPHFSPPSETSSPQWIVSGFFVNPNTKDLAFVDSNKLVQLFRNADAYANGTCQYPVGPAVQVCLPGRGVTTSSPVQVVAAYHALNYPAHRMEIWLDGVKKKQIYNDRVNSSFTLGAGTHTLSVVGVDMTNRPMKNTFTFSVAGSSGCSAPSSAGVHICSPVAGSTVSSPVSISAGARAGSGNITAMRIYVDGVSQYTQSNSSASPTMSLNKSLTISAGTHNLTIVAYQSTGGTVKGSESITVK